MLAKLRGFALWVAVLGALLTPINPTFAADGGQTSISQALSFCIDALKSKSVAAETLEAKGFTVEVKRKKKFSALKTTDEARVLVYIENITKMRGCGIETSPVEYGGDIRGYTLEAIAEWAKSNKARVVSLEPGVATILVDKAFYAVGLSSATFRGRITGNLYISLQQ